MTDNKKIVISCPNCDHLMKLGDSYDNVNSDENWNTGCWTEAYACPECGIDFNMDIHFNIEITSVVLSWVEGEDE